MVFWLGILVGAIFAILGAKKRLYETWAIMFNVLISIYLAIYLTPIIKNFIPAAGDISIADILTTLSVAIASFVILHGIAYVLILSQFNITFPKILDVIGAGFLGFITGILIWNFASLLICASPLSQKAFVQSIGFNAQTQQSNISYISWWGDLVNSVVSSEDSELTTEKAIKDLLKTSEAEKKQPKLKKPLQPEDTNEPAKCSDPNKTIQDDVE